MSYCNFILQCSLRREQWITSNRCFSTLWLTFWCNFHYINHHRFFTNLPPWKKEKKKNTRWYKIIWVPNELGQSLWTWQFKKNSSTKLKNFQTHYRPCSYWKFWAKLQEVGLQKLSLLCCWLISLSIIAFHPLNYPFPSDYGFYFVDMLHNYIQAERFVRGEKTKPNPTSWK